MVWARHTMAIVTSSLNSGFAITDLDALDEPDCGCESCATTAGVILRPAADLSAVYRIH